MTTKEHKVLCTFKDCPLLCDLLNKYKIKFDVFRANSVCNLGRLCIPEQYRGRGIGSKVMEYFVQWLDENEFDCELLASKRLGTDINVLIDFYSSFGYNVCWYDSDEGTAKMFRLHA